MAEAKATRPAVVGNALNQIAGQDSEILQAVMEVMETEKLLASGASVDVLPSGANVLLQLGQSEPHVVTAELP
jgi:hypothetical protein